MIQHRPVPDPSKVRKSYEKEFKKKKNIGHLLRQDPDFCVFQYQYLLPMLIERYLGLEICNVSGNLHNTSIAETVMLDTLSCLQLKYRSRFEVSIRHSFWNHLRSSCRHRNGRTAYRLLRLRTSYHLRYGRLAVSVTGCPRPGRFLLPCSERLTSDLTFLTLPGQRICYVS